MSLESITRQELESAYEAAKRERDDAMERIELVKAALVTRMSYVVPCARHAEPRAVCAVCAHDMFIASLVGAVTGTTPPSSSPCFSATRLQSRPQ